MKVKQKPKVLMTLLRDVASGRILPAAMQRPYVWQKAEVEALCDSIMCEFPIGAFVMWNPGPKADLSQLAKGRLGPLLPANTDASYSPFSLLLDGQNRAATFAWMMVRDEDDVPQLADASDAERATWLGSERLVLDWATRSVKFVPKDDVEVGLRMPAWTLLSTANDDARGTANKHWRRLDKDIWPQYADRKEADSFLAFYELACDRFREAWITETTIEGATRAEARHAFQRLCRTGVPMSQEDFDRAIGWNTDE